ncbi:hypothetical protein ABW19_dt0201161 [Dactylella cylindrospora]|nr:hypothetical protein ABW19_dt0201161 [Dactylella cylindrospora]
MERFVATVLQFPSSSDLTQAEYNKDLKSLYDFLSKVPAHVLAGTRESDPLELFDNRSNSLGVLFVFLARLSIDKSDIQSLWPRLIDYFSEFDGRQTRYARDQLLAVLKSLLSFCDAASKPILTIKPLEHTISQINYPNGSKQFSSLHTKLVRKCLDSKCFRAALPTLDIDIEEFPAKGDKENFQFPKTIPSHTLKIARTLSRPYEAFATAYATGDPDLLRREAKLVKPQFEKDGNQGLAEQCLENFRRLGIKALTHTYSTLSVETIASRDLDVQGSRSVATSPDDLERYILDMIDRNEINASLSHLPPSSGSQSSTSCMVSFHDLPALETNILKDLEVQISRTVQITTQARQLDRKLGLSKEWINFTSKKSRGAVGPAEHADQGYEEMEDYALQGRSGSLMDIVAATEGGYMNAADFYDPADDEMRPDYDD